MENRKNMKRVSIVVLLILMLIMTSCSGYRSLNARKLEKSEYDTTMLSRDINVTVKEETVTTKTESITLMYVNTSDTEYLFGEKPHLEVELDGTWYVVPVLKGTVWIAIGYILPAKGSHEHSFSIRNYYGMLKPGKYRVIKEMYSGEESVFTSAQFEITDVKSK